jgi:hypothetical protein
MTDTNASNASRSWAFSAAIDSDRAANRTAACRKFGVLGSTKPANSRRILAGIPNTFASLKTAFGSGSDCGLWAHEVAIASRTAAALRRFARAGFGMQKSRKAGAIVPLRILEIMRLAIEHRPAKAVPLRAQRRFSGCWVRFDAFGAQRIGLEETRAQVSCHINKCSFVISSNKLASTSCLMDPFHKCTRDSVISDHYKFTFFFGFLVLEH